VSLADKLRACPFCGGLNLETHSIGEWWYVTCVDCSDLEGPNANTKDGAESLWNRRIPDPDAVVAQADYSGAVEKFDDCRGALACVYKTLTGEEPVPPDDWHGEWHQWLIGAVNAALAKLEKK